MVLAEREFAAAASTFLGLTPHVRNISSYITNKYISKTAFVKPRKLLNLLNMRFFVRIGEGGLLRCHRQYE